MYIYMYMYVCVCVCLSVSLYISLYIYIYICVSLSLSICVSLSLSLTLSLSLSLSPLSLSLSLSPLLETYTLQARRDLLMLSSQRWPATCPYCVENTFKQGGAMYHMMPANSLFGYVISHTSCAGMGNASYSPSAAMKRANSL